MRGGQSFFLFFLAAVLSFLSARHLVPYQDTIELVFPGSPVGLRETTAELKIRELAAFDVLTRYTGATVSVTEGRSADVSVYTCSPELVRIVPVSIKHGNFLSDVEPLFRRGCVVIGEALASELFSYTDCVNQALRIGDQSYTVVGVAARRNAIVETFGSLERHAVYVYEGDYASWTPGKSSLIAKCRENTAGMVLARLSGLNADAYVHHDAAVRFSAFLSRLLLLLGLSLPLAAGFRDVIKRARSPHTRLGERVDIPSAVLTLVFAPCALYLLIGLRPALDARMIPPSLADLGGIVDKLRDWATLANNGQTSGGLYDATLRVSIFLAEGWALVGFLAGYRLRKLYREVRTPPPFRC